MTPERASGLVGRWVRHYTRDVPGPLAERRVEEIGSDLHDHIAHERGRGTSDRRIALEILSRMARGASADLSWRRRVRPVKGDFVKPLKPFAAVLAAAIVVAVIALFLDSPLVLMVSVALIFANGIGVFLLGARAAHEGNFLVPFVGLLTAAMGVAALAVAAIVFGERGDAPGLVLLGVVLISCVIVGAFALGARTAQRSR